MGLRTQSEGYTIEEEGVFLPLRKERKGIWVGTDIDKFVSIEEGS